MNIFVLACCPGAAADAHCDAHVLKMIVEITQLLFTFLNRIGVHLPNAYKPTHANHPCCLWILGGAANFDWLLKLGLALCARYTDIYGKTHACEAKLRLIRAHVDRSTLPMDVGIDEWLLRLSVYGVSDAAIAGCAEKATTLNAPHGCAFGVLCADAPEAVAMVDGKIDLIESYRRFYAIKAKERFVMKWHQSSDVPEILEDAFCNMLPDTPLLAKKQPKRSPVKKEAVKRKRVADVVDDTRLVRIRLQGLD